jgi:hypothetical protein
MKKEISKTKAIILLIVLVAIGGIVLYGENKIEYKQKAPSFNELLNK